GIRDDLVTGVQTCALPIYPRARKAPEAARATSRALAPQGAIRIPVVRSLGESFERCAFKIRKVRAPRASPVPARDPERAIHMLRSEERRVGKGGREGCGGR